MRVAIPCIKLRDILRVSPHFGRAPLFAIYELTNSGFKLVALEENPAMRSIRERGEAIAQLLAKYGVDTVIVYEIGPGAYSKLVDRGIQVFLVNELVSVEEALRLFKEGKLTKAEGPTER